MLVNSFHLKNDDMRWDRCHFYIADEKKEAQENKETYSRSKK